MKTFRIGLIAIALLAVAGLSQLHSQPAGVPGYLPVPGYRAPGTTPGTPGTPGLPITPPSSSTKTNQSTFRDLSAGDYFFFTTDTKKAFLWTKLDDRTAQNTVNSNKAVIGPFIGVSKQ